MTLRQFTEFHCLRVPKHHAFHRDFNRLTPKTLRAINDLVVQASVDLCLEDGSKLRVDTTVVETNIHHPTDNTLLWDVVRVVTRLVGRLTKATKSPCAALASGNLSWYFVPGLSAKLSDNLQDRGITRQKLD